MSPEEEIEAIQIEMELRRRKRDSSSPVVSSTTTEEVAVETPQGDVAVDASVQTDEAEPKKNWEAMTPRERFGLMVSKFPQYAKKEVLGAAEAGKGMAVRTAGPTLGQFIGRYTKIPGADRVLGAVGGAIGEGVAQSMEDEPMRIGAIGGAALSGAILGKPLSPSSTVREVATEGGKYAAANVAESTVGSLYDRGELPSTGEVAADVVAGGLGAKGAQILSQVPDFSAAARQTERQRMMKMRNDAFKAVQKEGIVLPPHELGEGSDIIASIGGKAALSQDSSIRQAPAWQRMVREDLGLSKEALPISRNDLKNLREDLAAPYKELDVIHKESKKQLEERLSALSKISDPREAEIIADSTAMRESLAILEKWTGADVEALKKARNRAQNAFDSFKKGDPNAYEPWQAAKAEAAAIEQAIEDAALSLGDDKLLNRLRDSRKKIAQSYTVEEALNPATGLVDPAVFGKQLDFGEPLTGNLKKIADFQLAFNRDAVEATRVPNPNVNNLGSMNSLQQASRGDLAGGVGAVVGSTMGKPVRSYLLSDFVQKGLLQGGEKQNFASALARYLSENSLETRPNSETVIEETVTTDIPAQ